MEKVHTLLGDTFFFTHPVFLVYSIGVHSLSARKAYQVFDNTKQLNTAVPWLAGYYTEHHDG